MCECNWVTVWWCYCATEWLYGCVTVEVSECGVVLLCNWGTVGLCYFVTECLWGSMFLMAVCSLYSCIQSPCVQMYSLTLIQNYCSLAWVMSQASPNMIPVTDDKWLSNSFYRGLAQIILNTTTESNFLLEIFVKKHKYNPYQYWQPGNHIGNVLQHTI